MAKRVRTGAKPAKEPSEAKTHEPADSTPFLPSGVEPADSTPLPPRGRGAERSAAKRGGEGPPPGRPSALIDTRVIYCGDCLEQLRKLPEKCVDLIYIDPPFNSNRNYEVFWGETREKRSFEDRHASTESYINYMRTRCYELRRRSA